MNFARKINAGFRTAAAYIRSCPGWERDLAMIYYRENDLQRAAEKHCYLKELLIMQWKLSS